MEVQIVSTQVWRRMFGNPTKAEQPQRTECAVEAVDVGVAWQLGQGQAPAKGRACQWWGAGQVVGPRGGVGQQGQARRLVGQVLGNG
jgi:hypothetical protein